MWFELIQISVLISGLFLVAQYLGSRSRRLAELCCLISILIISLIWILHLLHLYTLFSALDWITLSRLKFILLAAAVTFGLAAGLNTITSFWRRMAVRASLIVFLYVFIVLPFVIPAAIQNETRTLPLLLEGHGFCIQSRPYTCGPAAAVSALSRVGISAREGQIALGSRTAPLLGTNMWDLYKTVERICEKEHIPCSYQRMADLDQLPPNSICMVSIKAGTFVSHCVTVLNYNDRYVTLADPAVGLRYMTRREFNNTWYHTAVILTKPAAIVSLF